MAARAPPLRRAHAAVTRGDTTGKSPWRRWREDSNMMKKCAFLFFMTLVAFSVSLAFGAEGSKEVELEISGMT